MVPLRWLSVVLSGATTELAVCGVRDRGSDATDANSTAACGIDILGEQWKVTFFGWTKVLVVTVRWTQRRHQGLAFPVRKVAHEVDVHP